jgi:hypothetical protein
MEQDPEKSLENIYQPSDLTQDLVEDPIPNLIEQTNRFRSKIPEACQELFDKVKESYQVSFVEFPSLGKEVSPTDIQVKYLANLYLKERVVGQLYIPHLEFDDDINEKFSSTTGNSLCSALETGDSEAQAFLDNFRAETGSCMLACYYLPKVTKIAKEFEKELLQLFLLEEIISKESTDKGALMELQSRYYFSGDFKQKSASLMDHRFQSIFIHFDLEKDEKTMFRIKGILLLLTDKSVVEMKAEAIKQQKLADLQNSSKAKAERYSHQSGYLERMKKYHNLYQSNPKYDEGVLHQLFLRLDIDGDGKLGKEDLWNFCKKHKVIITKEVGPS